ncbi:hypothetical protein T12_5247 [Trichinella patagoniensis]|uniref:Uncharacterized protein n=1 Tax=Trichinella patagoniensis TaxID=990121 RepID=A0A0V0Z5C9_9BILA|nr:hypothetical protein T12_5247 [Trichinella patagoniensis]
MNDALKAQQIHKRNVESASSMYYPSPVYLAPFVNRAKTDSGIVAERTPLAGSPFKRLNGRKSRTYE